MEYDECNLLEFRLDDIEGLSEWRDDFDDSDSETGFDDSEQESSAYIRDNFIVCEDELSHQECMLSPETAPWIPRPSLSDSLRYGAPFLAHCAIMKASDSKSSNSDHNKAFIELPMEVHCDKAFCEELDVVKMVIEMLAGYQSELFHICPGKIPNKQTLFYLTPCAFAVTIPTISPGAFRSILHWLADLASLINTSRYFVTLCLEQQDSAHYEQLLFTVNYLTVLETFNAFLCDLLASIDKKLVIFESVLELHESMTLISLYISVKPWKALFRSINSIATCLFSSCTVAQKIQRVNLSGVLQELEALLEAVHILGLDACSIDMSDPFALNWKKTNAFAFKNSTGLKQHMDDKPYATNISDTIFSLMGPTCFHILMHEESTIDNVLERQVQRLRSPSVYRPTASSTSSGPCHRLVLRLPSTIREQSIIGILCRQVYLEVIASYLKQLIVWSLNGGPRRDMVTQSIDMCALQVQGHHQLEESVKHNAKAFLTMFFLEIPSILHSFVIDLFILCTDISLLKHPKTVALNSRKIFLSSIQRSLDIFTCYFKKHQSEIAADELLLSTNLTPFKAEDSSADVAIESSAYPITIDFPLTCMSNLNSFVQSLHDRNTISTSQLFVIANSSNSSKTEQKVELKDKQKVLIDLPSVFIPAKMKTRLSVISLLYQSLEIHCRASTTLLREEHHLIQHITFLQSAFTLRKPVCFDPLKHYVLTYLGSGTDEFGNKNIGYRDKGIGTDALSSSLSAMMTEILSESGITHVAVRVPGCIHNKAFASYDNIHQTYKEKHFTESDSIYKSSSSIWKGTSKGYFDNEMGNIEQEKVEEYHKYSYMLATGIQVEIHFTWPLCEIFTIDTLHKYNSILRGILQINCVLWTAEGLWQTVMKSKMFSSTNVLKNIMGFMSEENFKELWDTLVRTRISLHQMLYVLNCLSQSYLIQIHSKLFPELCRALSAGPIMILSHALILHIQYVNSINAMVDYLRSDVQEFILCASKALTAFDNTILQLDAFKPADDDVEITEHKCQELLEYLLIADQEFKLSREIHRRIVQSLVDLVNEFGTDSEETIEHIHNTGTKLNDNSSTLRHWAIHLVSLLRSNG